METYVTCLKPPNTHGKKCGEKKNWGEKIRTFFGFWLVVVFYAVINGGTVQRQSIIETSR
jgi:hypothetical protein